AKLSDIGGGRPKTDKKKQKGGKRQKNTPKNKKGAKKTINHQPPPPRAALIASCSRLHTKLVCGIGQHRPPLALSRNPRRMQVTTRRFRVLCSPDYTEQLNRAASEAPRTSSAHLTDSQTIGVNSSGFHEDVELEVNTSSKIGCRLSLNETCQAWVVGFCFNG